MPHTSETRIRVRYAETDQMGVVYYANYFIWMEVARTDFCKTIGINYGDMERDGAFMAVVDANCRYLAPALYDNEILVRTRLDRVGRKVVIFSYAISNTESGQLLAEGKTVHVTMGADKKSRPIPAQYFELLSKVSKNIP